MILIYNSFFVIIYLFQGENMERTYIMIKPDAYKKGVMGKVISRIEDEGFKIVNMKMLLLDKKTVDEHYAHLLNLEFYPQIASFMMSGPVVAMIVEGKDAVSRMRKIMGPTKFDAEKSIGTIRGQFADNVTENIIHGSDSIENAEIEIKRFFKDKQSL